MSHLEKFRAALSVLAGHGHIKQRLIEAFDQNLRDLDESSLPLIVREPFADLRLKMSQVAPLNGEGPICASVRKMSIDEADACSQLLLDLYADVIRSGLDDEEAEPVSAEDNIDVPAMLLKSV
jgi:hypothetical protein